MSARIAELDRQIASAKARRSGKSTKCNSLKRANDLLYTVKDALFGAASPETLEADWVDGWNDIAPNKQGQCTTCQTFFNKPITTQAIRMQHLGGGHTGGWYRVTEIEAINDNGDKIAALGARTDSHHGHWCNSNLAPELYGDSAKGGNDHGVHFHNHATIWFAAPVEIKSIKMVQLGVQHGIDYANANFKWHAFKGEVTAQDWWEQNVR
jgi:hypothetical protein